MPKNIVVCCDGTANQFSKDRTNVVKLFYTLVDDPAQQACFYHPGVGTMEAVGAVTSWARWVTKVLGLAFGYGLERDIGDAYVFLMKSFEPGDRVYLFGFSRGAYTARAVASLLHMYGLIPKGNEPLVPYAIRLQTAINKLDKRSNEKAENPKLGQKSGETSRGRIRRPRRRARPAPALGRRPVRPRGRTPRGRRSRSSRPVADDRTCC